MTDIPTEAVAKKGGARWKNDPKHADKYPIRTGTDAARPLRMVDRNSEAAKELRDKAQFLLQHKDLLSRAVGGKFAAMAQMKDVGNWDMDDVRSAYDAISGIKIEEQQRGNASQRYIGPSKQYHREDAIRRLKGYDTKVKSNPYVIAQGLDAVPYEEWTDDQIRNVNAMVFGGNPDGKGVGQTGEDGKRITGAPMGNHKGDSYNPGPGKIYIEGSSSKVTPEEVEAAFNARARERAMILNDPNLKGGFRKKAEEMYPPMDPLTGGEDIRRELEAARTTSMLDTERYHRDAKPVEYGDGLAGLSPKDAEQIKRKSAVKKANFAAREFPRNPSEEDIDPETGRMKNRRPWYSDVDQITRSLQRKADPQYLQGKLGEIARANPQRAYELWHTDWSPELAGEVGTEGDFNAWKGALDEAEDEYMHQTARPYRMMVEQKRRANMIHREMLDQLFQGLAEIEVEKTLVREMIEQEGLSYNSIQRDDLQWFRTMLQQAHKEAMGMAENNPQEYQRRIAAEKDKMTEGRSPRQFYEWLEGRRESILNDPKEASTKARLFTDDDLFYMSKLDEVMNLTEGTYRRPQSPIMNNEDLIAAESMRGFGGPQRVSFLDGRPLYYLRAKAPEAHPSTDEWKDVLEKAGMGTKFYYNLEKPSDPANFLMYDPNHPGELAEFKDGEVPEDYAYAADIAEKVPVPGEFNDGEEGWQWQMRAHPAALQWDEYNGGGRVFDRFSYDLASKYPELAGLPLARSNPREYAAGAKKRATVYDKAYRHALHPDSNAPYSAPSDSYADDMKNFAEAYGLGNQAASEIARGTAWDEEWDDEDPSWSLADLYDPDEVVPILRNIQRRSGRASERLEEVAAGINKGYEAYEHHYKQLYSKLKELHEQAESRLTPEQISALKNGVDPAELDPGAQKNIKQYLETAKDLEDLQDKHDRMPYFLKGLEGMRAEHDLPYQDMLNEYDALAKEKKIYPGMPTSYMDVYPLLPRPMGAEVDENGDKIEGTGRMPDRSGTYEASRNPGEIIPRLNRLMKELMAQNGGAHIFSNKEGDRRVIQTVSHFVRDGQYEQAEAQLTALADHFPEDSIQGKFLRMARTMVSVSAFPNDELEESKARQKAFADKNRPLMVPYTGVEGEGLYGGVIPELTDEQRAALREARSKPFEVREADPSKKLTPPSKEELAEMNAKDKEAMEAAFQGEGKPFEPKSRLAQRVEQPEEQPDLSPKEKAKAQKKNDKQLKARQKEIKEENKSRGTAETAADKKKYKEMEKRVQNQSEEVREATRAKAKADDHLKAVAEQRKRDEADTKARKDTEKDLAARGLGKDLKPLKSTKKSTGGMSMEDMSMSAMIKSAREKADKERTYPEYDPQDPHRRLMVNSNLSYPNHMGGDKDAVDLTNPKRISSDGSVRRISLKDADM